MTSKSSKFNGNLKDLILDGPQIASTASTLGSNFASLVRESSQNVKLYEKMHNYLVQMDTNFKKAISLSNRDIKTQLIWDHYNTHIGVELNQYRTELDFIFDLKRLASPNDFKVLCQSDRVAPKRLVSFIDEKFHVNCKTLVEHGSKVHPDTNIIFQTIRTKLPWKLDDNEDARLKEGQSFLSKHHFHAGYNMSYTSLKISNELDKQPSFHSVTDAIVKLNTVVAQSQLPVVHAHSCYIEILAHHFDYRRDIILNTTNIIRMDLTEIEQLAGLCAGFLFEGDNEEAKKNRDEYIDKVTLKVETLSNFLFDSYVDSLIEKYWPLSLRKLTETKFDAPFPSISTYNKSAVELKNLLDTFGSTEYKHQVFATNTLSGDQAKVFYLHSCPSHKCQFMNMKNNHLVVITRFIPADIEEDQILASNKWVDDFTPKIITTLDAGEYYQNYVSLAVINIELKMGGMLVDSNFSTILVARNWQWQDQGLRVNIGIGPDESTIYNTTRQIFYFTSGSNGLFGIAEMFKFIFLL